MVSQNDFDRGLKGFGIIIAPEDRRLVFSYLTDIPVN